MKVSLPHETITREDVIAELDGVFEEEAIQSAFTSLCDENRLLRVGNCAEYIMIQRDLF